MLPEDMGSERGPVGHSGAGAGGHEDSGIATGEWGALGMGMGRSGPRPGDRKGKRVRGEMGLGSL